MEGENVIAEEPDRDDGFEAIYAAVERNAKMTSAEKIVEKASTEIESVEGGEKFLED